MRVIPLFILIFIFNFFILKETPMAAEEIIRPVEKILPNERPVSVQGSMGAIYGLMALPDLAENERCPMVVLCHGFRGTLNYHLWPAIIEILNANGVGTLRFDFCGAGKSGGEFVNMTVPTEIDDLMSVISWVRARPETSSISLAGHSQGGVVAGMTAGRCGGQIASLVLLSAAAVLREDALRGNTQGARYDPWHLDKEWYPLPENFKLGRAYIQTAMNLPIYETTAAYKGPALIINGMADQVVPYTYAQRYKDVLPQAELLIVPGENHALSVAPDYIVKLTAMWLLNELRPRKN